MSSNSKPKGRLKNFSDDLLVL